MARYAYIVGFKQPMVEMIKPFFVADLKRLGAEEAEVSTTLTEARFTSRLSPEEIVPLLEKLSRHYGGVRLRGGPKLE